MGSTIHRTPVLFHSGVIMGSISQLIRKEHEELSITIGTILFKLNN